ncbi:MAG: Spy/CpxP family protein refolding chaperone [Fimbriimonas sp.]
MKKLALTLIALGATLGLAGETFAQAAGPRGGAQGGPGQGGPGGPGGRMRGGGMRRMQEMQAKIFAQLKVTPAQKTKIDALNKKTQAKFQAMMKDFKPGGDREAIRKKFRGVQDEHRKEMDKILTPDQRKKYDTLMKAERAKMRSMRGGPGGPGARPGGPGAGAPGRPGGRPGG